jgi:hypothetical protein
MQLVLASYLLLEQLQRAVVQLAQVVTDHQRRLEQGPERKVCALFLIERAKGVVLAQVLVANCTRS